MNKVISKEHIVFNALGIPNKNGDLYPIDMKMTIPLNVPITLNYSVDVIGQAVNLFFEGGTLKCDLIIENTDINLSGKFPGVCLYVDEHNYEEDPPTHIVLIKEADLKSIGINNNNVDPTILPIEENIYENK